jgi:thymidine kinase|tara:strand:- start:1652 stop:2185 length:534 start_codon:yes stop_codon:yes gene_type:complete
MSLTIIIGSMYSGKSTLLINKVETLKVLGMKCLVINHVNDTRVSGSFVQTHDGHCISAIKTNDILLTTTTGYEAVAIDEAQFFPNLKTAVMHMVEHNGQHVYVAGLNCDYLRNPFGEMLDLIPYADTIVWTRADCGVCKKGKASFTLRLTGETDIVSVGSAYVPACRSCYLAGIAPT